MHIKATPARTTRQGEGNLVGRRITDARFDAVPFGDDPWRLVATGDALDAPQLPSVFTIGNGFVGVRGPGEAARAPRVYLNGVYERVPIAYHEAAFGYARESDTRPAVADATRPAILVDGQPLGAPVRATLDMASGTRTEQWSVGGAALTLTTLASMARTAIITMQVAFDASLEGRVRVAAQIAEPPAAAAASGGEEGLYDPRLAPGFATNPWRSVVAAGGDGPPGRVDVLKVSGFEVAVCATALPPQHDDGETTIDVIASYAANRDGSASAAARAALADAAAAGFARLRDEQRDWFDRFWGDVGVDVDDDPRASQAVRHALFELVQAVGRDGRCSIAAKGQSGEGYEGHVFWDADLYVLPVFAFTRPEIARSMIAWRIAGLDAARDNARAMGQGRGALYPWRTIGGRECSSFFPAGSAQYHINADIAYALETYLAASGDRSILADGGAAMLVETARIWLEIGFHDPDRGGAFVINRVTGPDEYSAIVDNNLYTNMMAARHLRFAAREGAAASLIDADEAARMVRAADAMLLPYDADRALYLQDEGFFGKQPWPFELTPADGFPLLLHHHPLIIYRHRVAKQADAVLAVALMPDAFDPDMRRRMLDAYEAVTVHDSTLSASAFATAAARAGDAQRAVNYWRAAAMTDLADLFGNSDHGLHMAALAGSWSAIVFGFAGLAIDGDTLTFDPLAAPEIEPYSFKIAFRGSRLRIAVELGQIHCTLVDGAPVQIRYRGTEQMLDGDCRLERSA